MMVTRVTRSRAMKLQAALRGPVLHAQVGVSAQVCCLPSNPDSAVETLISKARGATVEVRTHPLTQFQSRFRLIPFGRQGFPTTL